ncbi:carbohydrate esterase family 4 protein [Mycena epipterygia]|nr:carbohydrate esterase family 4 protein [Mycena epipterygia]
MLTAVLLAALASVGSAFTLSASDGTYATVYTHCANEGEVAFTFDDGPYKYMKNISDIFTKAGGNCTFFVNGNNWDCFYNDPYPEYLQYAYGLGHQIGNHGWSHKDLTTVDEATLYSEIDKVDTGLQRMLGVTPHCMRPAYGNYNDTVLEALYNRSKVAIIWDVDSGDSTGANSSTSKSIYDTAIEQNEFNGTFLFLNHETNPTTVSEVIPYVIPKLLAQGYILVTIAQCLNIPAYTNVTTASNRTFQWHC